MSERNDGGPAFAHGSPEQGGHPGMTLRDYFAAKAMQTLINTGTMEKTIQDTNLHPWDATAMIAYRYADAMLKEREES